MAIWGKRKDGQPYRKDKPSGTKKSGSTKASGKALPSYPPINKNPLNTTKWSDAFKRFQHFKDKTNLTGFSFDPEEGIGYDISNQDQAVQFYYRFNFPPITQKPLYLVSMTNQLGGQLTRELHSNYLQAKNLGYSPLIGSWKDNKTGREYTDITIVMNNTSEKEAIKLAKNHVQDTIMVIYNNGDYDFIDTHEQN